MNQDGPSLNIGVILRCLWGLEAYIYIYNVYEFC